MSKTLKSPYCLTHKITLQGFSLRTFRLVHKNTHAQKYHWCIALKNKLVENGHMSKNDFIRAF